MGQLSVEQRVFIVSRYIDTQSIKRVQDEFRENFPGITVPVKTTILRNVRKFQRSGTTHNLNAMNSGRSRTARTADNIALVRDALKANLLQVLTELQDEP